jgi:hypothetical protein
MSVAGSTFRSRLVLDTWLPSRSMPPFALASVVNRVVPEGQLHAPGLDLGEVEDVVDETEQAQAPTPGAGPPSGRVPASHAGACWRAGGGRPARDGRHVPGAGCAGVASPAVMCNPARQLAQFSRSG